MGAKYIMQYVAKVSGGGANVKVSMHVSVRKLISYVEARRVYLHVMYV